MPRLLFGQFAVHLFENAEDVFLAKRTADAVAVEIHFCERARGFNTQVFESPALHDAVQALLSIRVYILTVRGEATPSPSMRTFHRLFLIFAAGRRRCAFVKRKNDVGTERVLDFNRALGCEAVQRAV